MATNNGNLVLTRAEGESFDIGDGLIVVEVVRIKNSKEVRLRITAPKELKVMRTELLACRK